MEKQRSAVLSGVHFFNGDVACAEGALASGCRFFAGYPILHVQDVELVELNAVRMP